MKLNELPITTVLRDYVPELHNLSESKSKRISVKCPFHAGKSHENMSVYRETNSAYCFGSCGYLDTIGVVARQLGISRKDARKELIQKYELESLSPEEEAEVRRTELLGRYVEACSSKLQEEHIIKLKERGLTEEIITKNKIGYHPEEFEDLAEQELLDLGIYKKDATGDIVSDFHTKIILPGYLNGLLNYIVSWNWQDIEGEPKYATPAGWPKQIIGTIGEPAYVVEGYFDLLACQQVGFDCLCTLGDKPTKKQNEFLRKQEALVVLFDGDESGQTAGRELARELFPTAQLVLLPAGEDPNSLCVSLGQDKFRAFISEAKRINLLQEAIELAKNQKTGMNAGKVVTSDIIPLLARIEPVLQAAAAKEIAGELKKFGITKVAIEKQLNVSTDEGDTQDDQKTQSEVLIELALQKADLFHNNPQDPFALVEINGHLEVWPVKGIAFKRWLGREFYNETKKAAGSEAVSRALNFIESRACFDGREHKLNLRVAEHEGSFWYDLGDSAWRFVKFSPNGWEIINRSPIIFRRYKNTAAQVEPKRGGNIWLVTEFLNLKNDDEKILAVIYLVAGLVPKIPHPVPIIYGEKGSAKSTAQRIFRKIIDPAYSELLTLPKSQDELALVLAHNYMPSFDNLSRLELWQSDFICKSVTGAGFSKRELWTDEGDIILSFLRCPALNGIPVVATQPDLLDRSIILKLERISPQKRLGEKELWEQFEKSRPEIVGGAFDALVEAMSIYPKVEVPDKPRMADFCCWGYAIAEALGIGGDKFLEIYYRNIRHTNEEAISSDPVALGIMFLVQEQKKWEGTATELMDALEKVAEAERIDLKAKSWPKSAKGMVSRIDKVKSNLIDAGINIEEEDNNHKAKKYFFTLAQVLTETSPQSPLSPEGSNGKEFARGDRWGDPKEEEYVSPCNPPAIPPSNGKGCGTLGDKGDYSVNTYNSQENIFLAVDLETTGLDPRANDIRLVSVAANNTSYVLDSPANIKNLLADPKVPKVFHNAAFDVHWLTTKGYPTNNYHDSMLMSQILDNNNGEHSLQALALAKLGIELDKSLQSPENWRGMLFDTHREYAKKDAEVTLKLSSILIEEIRQNGLEDVYRREQAALPAIIRLQQDGFAFNAAGWREDLQGHIEEKERLEAEIKKELSTDINLASPKQLLDCLQNRGLKIKSTNDEALAYFERELPVLAKLRLWREQNKLVTSYGEELLKSVRPDGRIYAWWRLIGATTGRMSCKEPNLQQVPHVLRKYFIAPPGRVLVIADYSQIELRVAAELSQDKIMIDSLKKGEDLHTKTARLILKKEEVSKEERQIAKAANFGLIYGMTPRGLQAQVKTAYGIDLSDSDAEAFRNGFFKLYPGIRKWHDRQLKEPEVKTVGGRRWRDLPKPLEPGWRNRLNYPVQGTAAEGLKEALTMLVRALPEQWKLAAVVHDEIVLDVPEVEVEDARKTLVWRMTAGMEKVARTVPVVVECTTSKNWLKS